MVLLNKHPFNVYVPIVLIKIPGGDLLSHTVTHAVPLAQDGLTSLFGMGRGVTRPLYSVPCEAYL